MKTQLKTIALAIALGLGSLTALAEDPVPAAPEAATGGTPAGASAPEAERGKSFTMSIGPDGAEVKEGADTDEGEGAGIRIVVDTDDEEPSGARRVEIAGKVVDRIVGDLERSLEDLPEDVRRDIDADDMRELRRALRDVRELKHGGGAVKVDGGFDEDLIPGIVAIVLLFGGPVVIVALVSYNNRRKRQMVHETIDRIIAQGKDVPVELLEALDKGDKTRNGKSMLARGVTNVALGLGISAVLFGLSGDKAASLGLIWLFYGLGQLLVWKLEAGEKTVRDGTPVS